MSLQQESQVHSIEKVESLIVSKYKSLPRNQKKVADFILNNLNEATFLSVIQLGEKSGTSKASVVRFAQSIGYEGFIEFRNVLHGAVQTKFSHVERFPLNAKSGKEIIVDVAQHEVKNINHLLDSLNVDTFKSLIQVLQKADCIYIYGQGKSALMGQLLEYSLNKLFIKTKNLMSLHLSFEEQMPFITNKDVVVFFLFPPYSLTTTTATRLAFEKAIKSIAITDVRSAPIVPFVQHCLFIQNEKTLFMNSFAAISVAINAITTELAIKSKEKK